MYYLDLNLNRLCMVSIAKTLWNTRKVRAQIKDFFRQNAKPERKEWYSKIIKNVYNSSEVLRGKLPTTIKSAQDDVILFLGEEIFNWIEYLMKELKLNFSFAEVIYFTPFGTIDECQIFHKYWCSSKKLFQKGSNYSLNELACIFMQKDFIFESKNDFINDWNKDIFIKYLPKNQAAKKISELGFKINKLKTDEDKVSALLATWINLRFRKYYFDFDENLMVDREFNLETKKFENARRVDAITLMLPVCLNVGMTNPFKYYFQRCYPIHKDSSIDQCVILQCRQKCKFKSVTAYEKKKYFEAVLFVIKEISVNRKLAMFSNHCRALLKWSIDHWPYQEFFKKIISKMMASKLVTKEDWKKFVYLLGNKEKEDYCVECPIHRSTYHSILKDLWVHAKEDVCRDDMFYSDILGLYMRSLNFRSMKILMPEINQKSESGLIGISPEIPAIIKRWINKENYSAVENFITAVFESDGERDEFKKQLKDLLLKWYISDGNYLELEKFFNCLYKSEDADIVRNEINEIEGCEILIAKGKPDQIYDFLKWFHNADEEKINEVRKRFRNDEKFLRKSFFKIFSARRHPFELDERENPDENKIQCQSFLTFVFDSVQDIENFKINALSNCESIIDYALVCDNNYSEKDVSSNFFPIKDLIIFCGIPAEKVDELKKKCLDKVEELMTLYTEKCKSYIVFDHLINWLVNKSSGRKQRLIKRLMKTPNGVLMCNKTLNVNLYLDKNLKNIILKFYNTWVRSCKNIPDIKKEIEILNKEKLTQSNKYKLSSMFNKLERGETVKFEEIVCFGKGDDDDVSSYDGGYIFNFSDFDEDEDDDDSHDFDFDYDLFDDYDYGSTNDEGSEDRYHDTDSDSVDSANGYMRDIFYLLAGLNMALYDSDYDDYY